MTGIPANVALEGWDFVPVIGESWVRETLKPAPTRPLTLGPNNWLRTSGVYLIDCFAPVYAESGNREADLLADAVWAHFPTGLQLNTHSQLVTIDTSSTGTPVRDKNFIMVPVTVAYHADTINT